MYILFPLLHRSELLQGTPDASTQTLWINIGQYLGFEGTQTSLTLETHTTNDCDRRALSWLLIVPHGFVHPLTRLEATAYSLFRQKWNVVPFAAVAFRWFLWNVHLMTSFSNGELFKKYNLFFIPWLKFQFAKYYLYIFHFLELSVLWRVHIKKHYYYSEYTRMITVFQNPFDPLMQ